MVHSQGAEAGPDLWLTVAAVATSRKRTGVCVTSLGKREKKKIKAQTMVPIKCISPLHYGEVKNLKSNYYKLGPSVDI